MFGREEQLPHSYQQGNPYHRQNGHQSNPLQQQRRYGRRISIARVWRRRGGPHESARPRGCSESVRGPDTSKSSGDRHRDWDGSTPAVGATLQHLGAWQHRFIDLLSRRQTANVQGASEGGSVRAIPSAVVANSSDGCLRSGREPVRVSSPRPRGSVDSTCTRISLGTQHRHGLEPLGGLRNGTATLSV